MITLQEITDQASDFDVFDVYLPDDNCAESIGRETLREIYRYKHRIAMAVRPFSIFEIGVRGGYSASAFLSARPRARYLGIDNNSDSHGGVCGYPARAMANLKARFPLAWIDIQEWDSLDERIFTMLTNNCGDFDLAHVDGDHTKRGCSMDLGLALLLLRDGGYLLVDDYRLIDDVRWAVDSFVRQYEVDFLEIPSPHGEMLIRKGS